MDISVSLPPELERFARDCVASGRFGTVGDAVRTGLQLLQEAERERLAFVASLDAAMEEGRQHGFLTAQEVEADAMAAIEAVRARGWTAASHHRLAAS